MALKGTTYIVLGGTKHPIFLGVNATALYCDLRGVKLTQYYNDVIDLALGGANPGIIRDVLYCAIEDGYRREKEDMPENFDRYTVGDQMDGITKKDIAAFLDAITESLPKPSEDQKKDLLKKKKKE